MVPNKPEKIRLKREMAEQLSVFKNKSLCLLSLIKKEKKKKIFSQIEFKVIFYPLLALWLGKFLNLNKYVSSPIKKMEKGSKKSILIFVTATTTVHSIQQALNERWSLFPFLWQDIRRSWILTVAAIIQFTDQNCQKVILYWPGVEREEKRPPCRDCQE